MTYGEALSVVNLYNDVKSSELKWQANIAYQSAVLNSFAFSEPKKMPAIHEAFPTLFEPNQNKTQDWRVMRDRLMEYSQRRREQNGRSNG